VHLKKANLFGANLKDANLIRSHLQGADLTVAHLEGADLTGGHLEGAELSAANLNKARLYQADLTAAKLNIADLRGAILLGAVGLTDDQLAETFGDETTELPEGKIWPAAVQWATTQNNLDDRVRRAQVKHVMQLILVGRAPEATKGEFHG